MYINWGENFTIKKTHFGIVQVYKWYIRVVLIKTQMLRLFVNRLYYNKLKLANKSKSRQSWWWQNY